MMDYEKLYDALMTIKNACQEMQDGPGCEKCPMSADDGDTCCVANTTPDNWDVFHPEIKVMVMR